MNYIDEFLNSITMYKLTNYCLLVLAVFAVLFGFFGVLPFSGLQLSSSAVFFILFCYFINLIFVKIFQAPATAESSVITAIILFFIMPVVATPKDILIIFLISLVAMASKYILAINKKHIFNPAAITAVIFGFTQNWGAFWWVANIYMVIPVCVAGFLIVRKIRRFPLFLACILGFLVSFYFINGLANFPSSLKTIIVSWPLVFFATIMLTEPATMPPKKTQQILYGLIIGLFLGTPMKIFGNIYTTPEIVLAVGNIASFAVSLKRKLKMEFQEKIQLAKNCYEFVFLPDKNFKFIAGQYLEWSLPHEKQDSRGIRRYFTIASAPFDFAQGKPEEEHFKIGIRFAGEKSSSFKTHLMQMEKGDVIFAGNLAGDFYLPIRLRSGQAKNHEKFVFIAGGIGITPFISIIRDLINKGAERTLTPSRSEGKRPDIILFYANKTEDIAYADLLKTAETKIGLKTIHLIGDKLLSAEIIKENASNFSERIFYLSGPNAMVDNYKKLIQKMGVKRSKIKTDYFPGF